MEGSRTLTRCVGVVSCVVLLTPVSVGRAQPEPPGALVHDAKLRLQPEETIDGDACSVPHQSLECM